MTNLDVTDVNFRHKNTSEIAITTDNILEMRLYDRLVKKGIAYEYFEHPPVFTVDESKKITNFVSGLSIRNLFLRDSKHRFFLICLPGQLPLNLKELGKTNTNSLGITGRLSFANKDELLDLLGVTAGSVNPFAVMCDVQQKVQIVIDKTIANSPCFNAHPMRNDRSIALAGSDLLSFLKQEEHEAIVFDFAKMERA